MNVLIAHDRGVWIAQGIEYDLVAQAKSIDDLRSELIRVVDLHVKTAHRFGKEAFKSLPAGPESAKAAFDKAMKLDFEQSLPARKASFRTRARLGSFAMAQ